ncbi:Cell-cycle nuclear protein, contains WD-40 repeats [Phaffia rhodozyma]|uniref:Cell-cycle nuclear protein, contains WD-40 repeats n=1 Tax=Phaffia rhodozyma TaxID=264483 RepID=A0A0F7SL55_PHARH|nr:Cell-cycle nuclear protein, contains WD-40 repeats [Phaffia rhodozyma]
MQNTHQQNQGMQQQQHQQQNPSPQAPPALHNGYGGPEGGMTLAGVLHYLQTEWRRWERDRNEWEIERAEMRARIALLEGERRSADNLKLDLSRRVKMLEFALRQERSGKGPASGVLAGGAATTAVAAIPPSKLSTLQAEDSKENGTSGGSDAGSDDGRLPNGSASPPTVNKTLSAKNSSTGPPSNGSNAPLPSWKTGVAAAGRDPKSRQRSRDYLKQCLQEISYLTSPNALNPLPNRPVAVPAAPASASGSSQGEAPATKLPAVVQSRQFSGTSSSSEIKPDDESLIVSSAFSAPTLLQRPRKMLSTAPPDSPNQGIPPSIQEAKEKEQRSREEARRKEEEVEEEQQQKEPNERNSHAFTEAPSAPALEQRANPLPPVPPTVSEDSAPKDTQELTEPKLPATEPAGEEMEDRAEEGEQKGKAELPVSPVHDTVESFPENSTVLASDGVTDTEPVEPVLEEKQLEKEVEAEENVDVAQENKSEDKDLEEEASVLEDDSILEIGNSTIVPVPEVSALTEPRKEKAQEALEVEEKVEPEPKHDTEKEKVEEFDEETVGSGEEQKAEENGSTTESQPESGDKWRNTSKEDGTNIKSMSPTTGRSGLAQNDEEELTDLALEPPLLDDEDEVKREPPLPTTSDKGLWKARNLLRGHVDCVRAVAFHETEPLVASASEDCTIKLWRVDLSEIVSEKSSSSEIEPLTTYRGHTKGVTSVVFDAPKGLIYSGSLDSTIRVWKVPSSSQTLFSPHDSSVGVNTLVGHSNSVWGLALVGRPSEGQVLVSVSSDGNVKVWNTEKEGCPLVGSWPYGGSSLEGQQGDDRAEGINKEEVIVPTCVSAVGTDDSLVAVGYSNSVVKIFNVHTGEQVKMIESEPVADEQESTKRQINKVITHPTMPMLITAHEDSHIRFFNLETGIQTYDLPAHADGVTSLFVSRLLPEMIVSGGQDASLRIWDSPSQTLDQELTIHKKNKDMGVLDVVVGTREKLMATAGADGTVRVLVWEGKGEDQRS